MPTYEVTEIVSQRPWPADGEPKRIYFNFKVKGDDRTLNIGRSPGSPLQVGMTVEGTVASEPDRGVYKVTEPQSQQRGGFGGGGRPRDPAERRSIEMQHAQKCATELLRVYALSNPDKMPAELKELTVAAKAVANALFLQVEEASKGDVSPRDAPRNQAARRDFERTGKSDITDQGDIEALQAALKYDGPEKDIPFPTKAEAEEMAAQARGET